MVRVLSLFVDLIREPFCRSFSSVSLIVEIASSRCFAYALALDSDPDSSKICELILW
ncbi:hypothetical protein RESH_05574 [Rhodopirellula europaea SH398]|uniref:Uncharacterized protein n=1 Tax=Rhodopirellula europaea SH398 TaxID=1263868 RepID=M5S867_9BACT|nr:hypothetical protein RESH_05574 [Rhodopirellula europaea SH398]